MVGRQIGSCALPGGCETPLTPIPPFCSLTQVKRKIAGSQSSDMKDLAYTTFKSINGFPRCNEPRTEDSSVQSLEVFGLSTSTKEIKTAGTSFDEVTWTMSSNAVFSSSVGIYKRNGIQVLATNIPMRYRKYTMTSTCAYRREQIDFASPAFELIKTTQNADCSYPNCSPSPATISLYGEVYPSVTTTGVCGGGGTITFNYIPVATGDIVGLQITPILGTWSIVVAGNLTISDTTGASYTFSGTLTSVAAAINATAGGTLFSASIPANINGPVALVSDLKPFSSKTNQPVGGCVVGLILIYSGDELAPSSICQGPFSEVYDFTGPQPLKFDQFAIDAGFADTSAGYLSWLSAVRTPKWPVQYVVDPVDDDTAWFTDSLNVLNGVSAYIQPVFGSPVGVFKTNWSTSAGVSSKPYNSVIACPFVLQTSSFQVLGTNCPAPFPQNTECPDGTNDGYGGFLCNPLPDCVPSYPFNYCLLSSTSFDCYPDRTFSGTLSVSGYWKFE